MPERLKGPPAKRNFVGSNPTPESSMKCPLCKRELIDGPSVDGHHLVPKTFGGKEVVILHKVCHHKIHSVFTERELLHDYNTIERLLQHEEIQKFVRWVRKKDPEYYDHSKDTNTRNRRRKR